MKRVIVASAIMALFQASAMAEAWPTMMSPIGPTAAYATVDLTVPDAITLGSSPYPAGHPYLPPTIPPPYGIPAVAAAGDSSIGNNYVLSTQLQFDPSNPTELGLVARAGGSVAGLFSVSLNPLNGGYLTIDQINYDSSVTRLSTYDYIGAHATFDATKLYKLVFNVYGSSLAAAVYEGSTLVASVANDLAPGTCTNGQIGMLDLYPEGGGPYLKGTFLNPTENPVLLGDANLSGKTDVGDLTRLLNNYNKPGMTWLNGDFTGDGTVNVADLTLLLNNYNKSVGGVVAQSGSLIGGSPVPEPSTICLVLIGCAMSVAYRLRGRR